MKVMMFNHNGSLNHGCEAIVKTTSKYIKKYYKNSEITLLSRNPYSDDKIKYVDRIIDSNPKEIRMSFLDKTIAYLQLKLIHSEAFVLKQMYVDTIKEIKNNDVCISIGGDTYCYGEQPWLYEVDKNIKSQGKKLILWGCSIGKEDLSARKLKDLAMFDLIACRESLTYNTLKRYGNLNVKLYADPAFLLEKEELPLPQGWDSKNTIGINLSPLVLSKNEKLYDICDGFIKDIIDNTKYQIALIPHVLEENNNDYMLLMNYYNKYKSTGRIVLLPDNLNAHQYKGYISRLRFFVGARTHATIAAYSSLVPTLVLGYSIKSRGIAKDIFGEEKYVVDSSNLKTKEELIKEFNILSQDEEKIRHIMETRIPEIKQLSLKAFRDLNRFSEEV